MSETGARTALLIPSRSFRGAKTRLDQVLDEDQRAALAEAMLRRTIASAGRLEAFVVTGDPEVASAAKLAGAQVIEYTEPGLNPAVAHGADQLNRTGFDRVMIAHGDIPLVDRLDEIDGRCQGSGFSDGGFLDGGFLDGMVIVPDRHFDGTNVMIVPTGCEVRWAYGKGSFHRHRSEAIRLGIPLAVLADEDLGWDLDEPADIAGALDRLPDALLQIITAARVPETSPESRRISQP